MEAILSAIERGELRSEAVLVFSDNPESMAIETARSKGIAVAVGIRPKGAELLELLQRAGADFIVLAGYLKLIPAEVVDAYEGRIINIHPALLPKFGGKGRYGMNVHRAVLEEKRAEEGSGEPYFTGATVHFVDREYDRGRILVQARVDVSDLTSAEEIAARVLICEHRIMVAALRILEEKDSEEYLMRETCEGGRLS